MDHDTKVTTTKETTTETHTVREELPPEPKPKGETVIIETHTES